MISHRQPEHSIVSTGLVGVVQLPHMGLLLSDAVNRWLAFIFSPGNGQFYALKIVSSGVSQESVSGLVLFNLLRNTLELRMNTEVAGLQMILNYLR